MDSHTPKTANTPQSEDPEQNFPERLLPALPQEIKADLLDIGEALGAALRLTEAQGEYDESTGEPMDSDAETEASALKALGKLEDLETKVKDIQKDILSHTLEAYKQHLYYDATAGFEYHGIDEQSAGDDLTGRFEGAYDLALKIVPGLDKGILIEEGIKDLVREIREQIPILRNTASKGYRCTSPIEPTCSGERVNDEEIIRALKTLLEKEEVLDRLLYHLEAPGHAAIHHQSEPAPGQPHNYALVLYLDGQEPGAGATDSGAAGATTIITTTSTEEAAHIRKRDLEAGAPVGQNLPWLGYLETGNLIVEQTGPDYL